MVLAKMYAVVSKFGKIMQKKIVGHFPDTM